MSIERAVKIILNNSNIIIGALNQRLGSVKVK